MSVTHLYGLAHRIHRDGKPRALFLRTDRITIVYGTAGPSKHPRISTPFRFADLLSAVYSVVLGVNGAR